jgi:2-polyprenyl-3-methyl-5-hydroxy-6-metoxy-1,4-benzoquinol methylase
LDETTHAIHAIHAIADWQVYLERMAKPLQEKLRIGRYVPPRAAAVLDVGCADGTVTCALATLFPDNAFLGIDLSEPFIGLARERAEQEGLANVRFERVYLRELLVRPERFDAVVFCSVLHEFYTYGEGISSVLKALADAHELLRPGGVIVIRDMVLRTYTRHSTLRCDSLRAKIEAVCPPSVVDDFVRLFGPLDTVYAVNHLLLKYWYTENWAREGPEHYVPVTFEAYAQVFRLLGMRLQITEDLTLPFLRDKWRRDFGLTEEELDGLRSTGILVAQKAQQESTTGGCSGTPH